MTASGIRRMGPAIVLAGMVGCTSAALQRQADRVKPLQVWRYEDPLAVRDRGDGEQFPRMWPVYASLWKNGNYRAPDLNHGYTILFSADPHDTNPAERNVESIVRYAVTCRAEELTAEWVSLDDQVDALFVLAYQSGGTGGCSVRAIRGTMAIDRVDANDAHAMQYIDFWEVMSAVSKLPVYIGDADGDGTKDLLVAPRNYDLPPEVVTHDYNVWQWKPEQGRLEMTGTLPVEVVTNDPRFRPLGSVE